MSRSPLYTEVFTLKISKQQKCDCGNIATWLYIPLDEKGREYPCCEYDYDEDGFDF